MFDGFSECWEDYSSRIDHKEKLVDYCRDNLTQLGLQDCCHLLGVGPGDGTIDAALVALLPQLELYTGVEPNQGLLDSLKSKLSHFINLKTKYVNGTLQAYGGPGEGCDVILMSHVVYYFIDCLEEQLRRALSWLKEGGQIIIVIDQDNMHKIIGSNFNNDWQDGSIVTAEGVRTRLMKMNIQFKEIDVHYSLDMSEPGQSYYGIFSVLMNRPATRPEVDKALKLVQHLFIAGTQKVRCTQSMFIIRKQ